MHLMLQQPKPMDYIIGTGVSYSVADFVTQVLLELSSLLGNTDFSGPIEKFVEVDSRLVRTNEIHDLRADATLARSELGWKPSVDFSGLVRMMVAADVAAVDKQGTSDGNSGTARVRLVAAQDSMRTAPVSWKLTKMTRFPISVLHFTNSGQSEAAAQKSTF